MWQDYWFSARDGARHYARKYSGGNTARRALMCLPGLTGNSAQFDTLARALCTTAAERRDIYTIDLHGRGRSDHAPDRGDDALLCDCEDALDFMTMCGLDRVALLGTGHGGQVAILMALLRPSAVEALILNDASPEFEPEGVARLMGEISSLPLPATFADAALLLRQLQHRQFPGLSAAEWTELAQAQYPEADGRPVRPYNQALGQHYSMTRGPNRRLSLWSQFEVVKRLPALLLRGQLSQMVSDESVRRMRDIHPALEVAEVAGEGHAPLLRDAQTIAIVAKFLARSDPREQRSDMQLKSVA